MTSRLDPQTQRELKELFQEIGPDTLLLLITNLAVIIQALFQGWDIVPLLWIYWFQNIIIGFFNWRRMGHLKQFSSSGLKINGNRVEPNEKTKKWMTQFFLLHYGTFHLFYLIFILSITERLPHIVILSAIVSITFFFFNHFYSYSFNLKKDLSSSPDIGIMSFFPYARVIPMHLFICIGLQFGEGSRTGLLIFLLLKTLVDVLMHVIQHINWNEQKEDSDAPSAVDGTEKSNFKKKKTSSGKRKTLKERLKLWFLLGWAAFLISIVLVVFIINEINK